MTRENKRQRRRNASQPFPVVGIGASAGGVQAFQAFFDHMPADGGMAFIAVPHLSPTEHSHMAAVLEPHTGMEVVTAEDGQTIEPGRVYVIPPDRYLTVGDGKIKLQQPREARGHRRPIDVFFHSLGGDLKSRAIAIVLSGTGTNGASGLRTVKGEGGFVLAQDPKTATHADMPRAAIDTGIVDEVLAPERMGEALMRFAGHPYVAATDADELEAEERDINALLSHLQARTGHDFSAYKRKTIVRRIYRRMGLKGCNKLRDYLQMVRKDEAEARALALDFMITVTGFFRDPEAWRVLEKQVIKPLVKEREGNAPVRIWVPGSATGEEAYSIGMLLLEQTEAAGKSLDIKIFATDTSSEGLEFAREGLYPMSVAADIPDKRRKRFFETEGDICRVSPQLRDIVVFAPQNVLQDPPFSRLDLVSCRNLLIYIEPDAQQKLLRLFNFALREGGHLFLGNAETVSGQERLFEPVSKKWRIYRSTHNARQQYPEFPVIGARAHGPEGEREGRAYAPRRRIGDIARDALLSQFSPAAVVVDQDFRIFYFHGDTDPYLRVPAGEPTEDLLAMIRNGLRAKVRSVLQRAIQTQQPAVEHAVLRNGRTRQVRVEVRPLKGTNNRNGMLIVTFSDEEESLRAPPPHRLEEETQASGVDELEAENKMLRDELRSSVEQMESANEELKASNEEILSMNEELQSSNEELETTKEELQTFNEELNTVNVQLESKVEELEQKSNDLDNLLKSTGVGTIFLDRELRIRWFSPAIEDVVDVLSTDVGRPVEHLRHKVEGGDLADDAERVLRTLTPARAEVRTTGGQWFIRDTMPYRTQDDRIDGVVITFAEVTGLKQAQEDLRASEQRLRDVLETEAVNVLFLKGDTVVDANGAFLRATGYTREQVERGDLTWRGMTPEEFVAESEAQLEQLEKTGRIGPYEKEYLLADGSRSWMLIVGRRLEDGVIVKFCIDIADRKQAEKDREILAQELNHRVKNSLMTVQAIAAHTARTSANMDTFMEAFEGRLDSLARGHELLMQSSWQAAKLDALVESAVNPFTLEGAERFNIDCGEVALKPAAALAITLILHELATNSSKHGALSRSEGLVEIACEMQDGKKRQPRLVWCESGGPKTQKPAKKGFGLRLIERSAVHELDGKAKLDFRPEGLCCIVEFSRNHLARA